MKVLLIAPTCDGEDVGEAWVAYQWAHGLAQRHDVTLLTYNKRSAKPASQQLEGLRIVEWSEPPILGRAERLNSLLKPGYVAFYMRARSWIRRALAENEHFDVAHQPVPVGMRYPSPCAGLGIPYVIGPVGGGLANPAAFEVVDTSAPWYMRLRGLDAYRRRWDPLLRRTYEDAACVVGIAPYVRDLLADYSLKRFETMSETGLRSVPEPIDRSDRAGPVRLLFVGRLVRTKGAREAIRAMAGTADLATRLDIVGDGPDRGMCESMIADLNLGDRVTMHGWKTKAQVAQFYIDADAFVFPSYREPGGNVAPEAMGYSLPLIVVDRGGPGAATTDDCAIRLPVATPEALARDVAAAIRKLVADPALRRRMGVASYDHVKRTALWPAKFDRMGEIYEEIAASGS